MADSGYGCRGAKSPSGLQPARERSPQRAEEEPHPREAAPMMAQGLPTSRGCQTVPHLAVSLFV